LVLYILVVGGVTFEYMCDITVEWVRLFLELCVRLFTLVFLVVFLYTSLRFVFLEFCFVGVMALCLPMRIL